MSLCFIAAVVTREILTTMRVQRIELCFYRDRHNILHRKQYRRKLCVYTDLKSFMLPLQSLNSGKVFSVVI